MFRKLMAASLSLAILFSLPVFSAPKDSMSGGQSSVSTGPKKQIATIIFAGLAGAVLGLSTLSFYGRPQDKLPNIGVGFALGIIIGAGFTTYKAATQPKEFYGLLEDELLYDQINYQSRQLPADVGSFTPKFSYEWTF